jgi:ribosomal protein S18 acetylase RimI-like enzyme
MTLGEQVRIRSADRDDLSAVLALVPRLRAFGPGPLRPWEALDAGEIRTIEHFFDSPPAGAHLWVAAGDRAGTIVGAAYAEATRDYFTQETHAHLGILVVAASVEGRGVGRALLATVEQWAEAQGYRFMTLNVFPENTRAIAVYESAGYRPDALRYAKVLNTAGPVGPAAGRT